jgi:hypothetical protein
MEHICDKIKLSMVNPSKVTDYNAKQTKMSIYRVTS